MHRHLVPVKVSIKRRTDQWVQLNGFAFDQCGFKRLNAQAVQRWRTVQHHRMFADHLIEDIPNFGTFFFNQLFGLFHG